MNVSSKPFGWIRLSWNVNYYWPVCHLVLIKQ